MAGNFSNLEAQCKKTAEHFKKELGRVRTGRANTSLLDGLHVEYYGSSVPLIQLGMVNAPEPRQLTIQVYDSNACEAIEKAIQQADLGVYPSRDGSTIRINFPATTEERRKEFVKTLHKSAEDERIVMRNHRRDAIDVLKKDEKAKKISADDLRKGQEEIQKITDRFIKEIDTMVAAKEKEIMEV